MSDFNGNPSYLMTCEFSSAPVFDAFAKSSSAVLYFLQLEEDDTIISLSSETLIKLHSEAISLLHRSTEAARGGSFHLRAKAMMELGSLSHTAMGTRSCSSIR